MTHTLLTLLLVHIAGMASPGPNFLLVTQRALGGARRDALTVAAGIATGAFFLSSAAAFGLSALLADAAPLYSALRLAASAYLVFLGLRIWRQATKPLSASPRAPASSWASYRAGLLTNLTNPKATVFFGAVFTSVIPQHA